jgi:RimJ/RimL family protein N-acetyltransferase
MAEKWWLAVMICLRPALSSSDASPTTIGYVSIQSWAGSMAIHRRGTLGIDIAAAHQRKGYGTEALEWAMNYGFEMAGLHTMGLSVVGWNAGAQRLYERMGFVRDGARRECFWAKGRFWDSIDMSMLESEWRQKYKGEKKVEYQKQEMEEEYVLI